MLEPDRTDSPPPLLSCGHRWSGTEPWEDMLVILKEEVDGRPAYSTGHWCRLCRARRDIEARRLGSQVEADAWLRVAGAVP